MSPTNEKSKDEQLLRDGVLIVLSSIVGALVSTYFTQKYRFISLSSLELPQIFDLIIAAMGYLIAVGIGLGLSFYGTKGVVFLLGVAFRPALQLLNWIWESIFGKYHEKRQTVGEGIDSLYKKHPEKFNVAIIAILIFIYIKYLILPGKIINVRFNVVLFVAAMISIIHYSILSIESLLRHNKSRK